VSLIPKGSLLEQVEEPRDLLTQIHLEIAIKTEVGWLFGRISHCTVLWLAFPQVCTLWCFL